MKHQNNGAESSGRTAPSAKQLIGGIFVSQPVNLIFFLRFKQLLNHQTTQLVYYSRLHKRWKQDTPQG